MSSLLWKQLFEQVSPTPIIELKHPVLEEKSVNLFLKLDYLNHPIVSGNKLRKLKYPLRHFFEHNYEGIISFGGVFSNHLHALSYAGSYLQIPMIGVVRGENNTNLTLDFCIKNGMTILPEKRSLYQDKPTLYHCYQERFPNHLLLPEGGSSILALEGAKELLLEIQQQQDFDEMIVAAGTGTTAAGMALALKPHQKLRVVNVLKGFSMKDEIQKNLGNAFEWNKLIFHDEAYFGGYANYHSELICKIEELCKINEVILDPIYVGKLLATTLKLIEQEAIIPKSKIIAIHTGGIQGILPFCQRYQLNPQQFGIE